MRKLTPAERERAVREAVRATTEKMRAQVEASVEAQRNEAPQQELEIVYSSDDAAVRMDKDGRLRVTDPRAQFARRKKPKVVEPMPEGLSGAIAARRAHSEKPVAKGKRRIKIRR